MAGDEAVQEVVGGSAAHDAIREAARRSRATFGRCPVSGLSGTEPVGWDRSADLFLGVDNEPEHVLQKLCERGEKWQERFGGNVQFSHIERYRRGEVGVYLNVRWRDGGELHDGFVVFERIDVDGVSEGRFVGLGQRVIEPERGMLSEISGGQEHGLDTPVLVRYVELLDDPERFRLRGIPSFVRL
jgi:hypothetical protein